MDADENPKKKLWPKIMLVLKEIIFLSKIEVISFTKRLRIRIKRIKYK